MPLSGLGDDSLEGLRAAFSGLSVGGTYDFTMSPDPKIQLPHYRKNVMKMGIRASIGYHWAENFIKMHHKSSNPN